MSEAKKQFKASGMDGIDKRCRFCNSRYEPRAHEYPAGIVAILITAGIAGTKGWRRRR